MIQYRRTVEVYKDDGSLDFIGQAIALSSTDTHLYVTVERVCPENEDYLELAEARYERCRFPLLTH